MALSDMAIRHARSTGKDHTVADSDGLVLHITARGAKIWYLRYYWSGKQTRMSLGSYPQVKLKNARTRRDEARALIAQGVNPCEQRREQRLAVRLAADHTFEAVFKQWLALRRLNLKEGRQSTLSQILRIFDKDILPIIGTQSIHEINRHVLMDLLGRIEQRKAFTTAEKCRAWLNQLFRYALVRVAGLEQNPAADLDVVALPKPLVEHNPFLRMDELPILLVKLRSYRGAAQTQLGLRLLLLTGVRTGELRLATPDQFDLERRLWIIPPEVVKQLQLKIRKTRSRSKVPPYIVPLSVQAMEVVGCLLDRVVPAQRYLLTHRSDLSKRISENTLNSALHRMGFVDRLTGHGMRATISTALNEIGYPKAWIDAQLSHADPDKVSAAYNHAEYVEQRRAMMQDWSNRLDLWAQGNVKAAGTPLTIRLEGTVPQSTYGPLDSNTLSLNALSFDVSSSKGSARENDIGVEGGLAGGITVDSQMPDIQRERADMLSTFEAASNLPLPDFARLAGRSRAQINRDIKARCLLSLSFGSRGQRVPDWQLDPLRHKLVMVVFQQLPEPDSWKLYRVLSDPHAQFKGCTLINALTVDNFEKIVAVVVAKYSASSR